MDKLTKEEKTWLESFMKNDKPLSKEDCQKFREIERKINASN